MNQELEQRLAHIERRLDALETGTPEVTADTGDPYWALTALRGLTTSPGAVLFTGLVDLPTGEHYEWQQGVPAEGVLESDWAAPSAALTALAHPARLRILQEVLRGKHATADLQALEDIGSTGQLYHHVRQLVAAGWLRTESRAHYSVPPQRVVPLLVIIAAAVS
ncbi:helix-turn-helix domain-containing protein [Paractinoplanes ferrugineus]|uniref:Transcriptional regulator n=1 Tax=Paractinoplanes ferrugineus TaxID=113564 RepID=A0A919J061_9ACTN|nr:helix-turn-helix domain-containing protein [Actinoplanes ferrugineus]GIE10513.1 transcriptional regulator [Actinoplanes ferrugineus]